MGELLLSLLKLSSDGTVVFSRKLKGSHYGNNDPVPFVYPNPNRKTKRQYYRILEKFYEPELIVELLRTQNPDVIDRDGKVPFQRELRDKDIYNLVAQGKSAQSVAQQYKWHRHAVLEACHRHKRRDLEEDSRVARPEDLVPYEPDETVLPQITRTPEQQAELEKLMEVWE